MFIPDDAIVSLETMRLRSNTDALTIRGELWCQRYVLYPFHTLDLATAIGDVEGLAGGLGCR
jgi:hypothetical protein